jgi:hypothetical protein
LERANYLETDNWFEADNCSEKDNCSERKHYSETYFVFDELSLTMILKDSEEYVDLQRLKEIQWLVLEFHHHSLCTQEHCLDRHDLLYPLMGNKTAKH